MSVSKLRWLPWTLAAIGVGITTCVTVCEVTGHSVAAYVPMEPIMGIGELLAWQLVVGDNVESRAEMYAWAFPFAAAFNGLLGWLVGFGIRTLVSANTSLGGKGGREKGSELFNK